MAINLIRTIIQALLNDGRFATQEDVEAKQTAELNRQRGAANGLATLDANAKVLESQLPAVALKDVFVVASQAAMLALVVERGDMAVRTDLNRTFVLQQPPANTLANWIELRTPTDLVQSVAGKTGVVTLVKADVGLGNVDNTSDANKPVSAAQQTALNAKANLSSPAFTDNPTAPTAPVGDNDTTLANTQFVQRESNANINAQKQANRLDTTAGRLLTPGAFGIGTISPPAPANNDANALTVSGNYLVQNAWMGSPFADGDTRNFGTLVHISWTATYWNQLFFPANFGPVMRRQNVNGTISTWQTVATTTDVEAAVKQAERTATTLNLYYGN